MLTYSAEEESVAMTKADDDGTLLTSKRIDGEHFDDVVDTKGAR